MNCMKYYKFTQYVWLKMQDFEVKNAKIFWGGLSPPQTPPNNEEGDTPSSNSSPQCREGSNFLSFIPPPPPENPGSVAGGNDSQCVNNLLVCDGHKDRWNGADEQECGELQLVWISVAGECMLLACFYILTSGCLF